MIKSFIFFTLLTVGSSLPNTTDVRIDPNTLLVLWGARHGNRNPEKYLSDNRNWGFEGTTELTSMGKRQAYGFGKELKRFINNLVSNNYLRDTVKYYSSSANRCQMTLQLILAGLHPPTEWADWNRKDFDNWSPIPYEINDFMLRMYAVPHNECPANEEVWEPISNDVLPELKEKLARNRQILTYAGQNTGWNMSSLSLAGDLADNLIEIDLFNDTYPDWIANPQLSGYSSQRLIDEYVHLAEAHQIACANYQPCSRLMTVVWLRHILDSLHNAYKADGSNKLKMIGYASHTEITLSLMRQMGILRDELTTSAGFIMEFRLKPSPSIRLLNHDPNPVDEHVIYKTMLVPELQRRQDSDGFIPYQDFLQHLSNKVEDWRIACHVPPPTAPAPPPPPPPACRERRNSNHQSYLFSTLSLFIILILQPL